MHQPHAPAATPLAYSQLEQQIERKQALLGVIGLGYVGLPLIRAFASAGFRCVGFDVDPAKVDSLNRGQSYIKHIESRLIAELVRDRRFEATADMRRLKEADCIIICVPTPLTDSRDPDLSYIERTTEMIAASLRPGQLVVLESTTYPTTTRTHCASAARSHRSDVWYGLLSCVQSRTRGSGKSRLSGGDDSQGGGRSRRAKW